MDALLNAPEYIIYYLFALPLLAAVAALVVQEARLQAAIVFCIGAALFGFLVYYAATVLWPLFALEQSYKLWHFNLLPRVPITFVVEPWGTLFALLVTFLWPLVTLYSYGYLKATQDEGHKGRYHACFALAIVAVLGIAFSGNLITLFLFYELLTLVTYPLVIHSKTPQARKAGRTYLLYLCGTSFILLLGALLYTAHAAGTFSFLPGGTLEGNVTPLAAGVLLFAFAYGFGKSALMPLHRWLPAAMVAPAPVSALLHAVAVVKGGVFGFVKVLVFIFGTEYLHQLLASQWLLWICAATALLASLMALQSRQLKMLLAYSTISQLAIIMMLALVATAPALYAAALQLVSHSLGKMTLFLAVGAFYAAAGAQKIEDCKGLARAMPYSVFAFAVGAAAMVGVPPTFGFIAKWQMFAASLDAMQMVVCATLVLSTVLNVLYFSKLLWLFFEKAPQTEGATIRIKEVGWQMRAVLLLLALTSVAAFFWPVALERLALQFSVL